jgi:hypothetical protein
MSGFALADHGAIDGDTMRGQIFDLQADHMAAAQLAVDVWIEHGQIPGARLHLKRGLDRPDVLGPPWGLRADQFPFISWGSTRVSWFSEWSIKYVRLLCLQGASAYVAFSRRPLAVRFRGIPGFAVGVISARKSESDPEQS